MTEVLSRDVDDVAEAERTMQEDTDQRLESIGKTAGSKVEEVYESYKKQFVELSCKNPNDTAQITAVQEAFVARLAESLRAVDADVSRQRAELFENVNEKRSRRLREHMTSEQVGLQAAVKLFQAQMAHRNARRATASRYELVLHDRELGIRSRYARTKAERTLEAKDGCAARVRQLRQRRAIEQARQLLAEHLLRLDESFNDSMNKELEKMKADVSRKRERELTSLNAKYQARLRRMRKELQIEPDHDDENLFGGSRRDALDIDIRDEFDILTTTQITQVEGFDVEYSEKLNGALAEYSAKCETDREKALRELRERFSAVAVAASADRKNKDGEGADSLSDEQRQELSATEHNLRLEELRGAVGIRHEHEEERQSAAQEMASRQNVELDAALEQAHASVREVEEQEGREHEAAAMAAALEKVNALDAPEAIRVVMGPRQAREMGEIISRLAAERDERLLDVYENSHVGLLQGRVALVEKHAEDLGAKVKEVGSSMPQNAFGEGGEGPPLVEEHLTQLLNEQKKAVEALLADQGNELHRSEANVRRQFELRQQTDMMAKREEQYSEFVATLQDYLGSLPSTDRASRELKKRLLREAEEKAEGLANQRKELEEAQKSEEQNLIRRQAEIEDEVRVEKERRRREFEEKLQKQAAAEKERQERALAEYEERTREELERNRKVQIEEIQRNTSGLTAEERARILHDNETRVATLQAAIAEDRKRQQAAMLAKLEARRRRLHRKREAELERSVQEELSKRRQEVQKAAEAEQSARLRNLRVANDNAAQQRDKNREAFVRAMTERRDSRVVTGGPGPGGWRASPANLRQAASIARAASRQFGGIPNLHGGPLGMSMTAGGYGAHPPVHPPSAGAAHALQVLEGTPLWKALDQVYNTVSGGKQLRMPTLDRTDGSFVHPLSKPDAVPVGGDMPKVVDIKEFGVIQTIMYQYAVYLSHALCSGHTVPPQLLVMSQAPDAVLTSDYDGSAFRRLAYYDVDHRTLFIHVRMFDTVELLSTILVHSCAHIRSGSMAGDGSASFQKELARCVGILGTEVFFARSQRCAEAETLMSVVEHEMTSNGGPGAAANKRVVLSTAVDRLLENRGDMSEENTRKTFVHRVLDVEPYQVSQVGVSRSARLGKLSSDVAISRMRVAAEQLNAVTVDNVRTATPGVVQRLAELKAQRRGLRPMMGDLDDVSVSSATKRRDGLARFVTT